MPYITVSTDNYFMREMRCW